MVSQLTVIIALILLLVTGVVQARPTSAAVEGSTGLTAATLAADTAQSGITVTTYSGGSTVLERPLYARTLDLQTSYRIFLPPDYESGWRRYPVLYMLHGVAGDSSEWQAIGLLEAADRLIQQGEIDPLIIVLPNGGASYWLNQARGARWADYVVNDVVADVDRTYRTIDAPQGRAIGGLSMGGEGALRIALTHPDVFGTAAAHSPSLRTAFDQFAPEVAALYGDEDSWRAATPLWLVVDRDTAYQLKLAIDVGEDDPWRPNVELLHQRMIERGIAHRFEVLPGEHAAEYWIENVERYLRFYGSALTSTAVVQGQSG